MSGMASNLSSYPAALFTHTSPQSLVLFPNDTQYVGREQSYWAANARLTPTCIVLPESSDQVSQLVRRLVETETQFAVRAGGHSPVPGAADIADGVTIDLSLLKKITVDTAAGTATFGAGARWAEVYKELTDHNQTVAGGRGGDVGVAGLLLGGGSSWMAAKTGWACDNVLSFEVVLADGRIVAANREMNSDLFKALKGGSNNFGIVTSFTMHTIPSAQIWGGIAATPESAISEVIDMQWQFTDQSAQHLDSYIMTVVGYFPDFGTNVASTAVFQAEGINDGAEFEEWRRLPKIADMTSLQTIHDLSHSITLPPNYHNAWFTLTVKNDRRIMNKAAEVHQELVDDLKSYVADGDFITQCIFQPLPTVIAERSVAAGGNVLGLERNSDNAILFQYAAMMKTAEQAAYVYPKLQAGLDEVKDFAAGIGGIMDWVYMNYADKSQDVLGGYGMQNVEFMSQVSAQYDPDRVFQKLCVGGWKLPES